MRDLMINTWIIIAIATGAVGISLLVSLASGDTQWFSRAGSVATVLGLLLLIKHNVLCSGTDLADAMAEKLHYRRMRAPPPPGSKQYREDLRRTRRILFDEFTGFMITIIGTVIWAYGDLLIARVL